MRSIIEFIEEVAEEGQGRSFRGAYSGRGMFGRECVGVVCPNPIDVVLGIAENVAIELFENASLEGDGNAVIQNNAELERQQAEEIFSSLKECHIDTMGHDKIIYWPGVQYTKASIQSPSKGLCSNYPGCGCAEELGEDCIPF